MNRANKVVKICLLVGWILLALYGVACTAGWMTWEPIHPLTYSIMCLCLACHQLNELLELT